ncbi:24881_t:CDS:2 [Cetraspora pellucida]|uniref:24881_t:CDS:1 n=1 Tax=Cetraspora pellucida TaxID=1433469 RepID=A0A9N9A385_9GLOM|nr:24881_t:CDS:2 [Cetraspora pellucida]
MIVISLFSKIIATFILIIYSITLVEAQFNCPSTPSSKEDLQTFIVQLSSPEKAIDHYDFLKSCFNKEINDNIDQLIDHTVIKIASFGSFICYIGQFSPSEAAVLASSPGVIRVENDKTANLFAPTGTNLTLGPVGGNGNLCTSLTEFQAPPNLDRIDQKSPPLDGKYRYPATSGLGVNVYIVDTGINTANSEFGGRAKLGPAYCDGCSNVDDTGMSIGGGFSQILNNVTDQLVNAGVHVVAAAGNSATDACNISPASAPNGIAVGATETRTDATADFSNFGRCVFIYAPGTNITAAGNSAITALATYSGTSQAAPHVAGTVALIIAKDGNKSPAEMKVELDKLSTKGIVTGNVSRTDLNNRFLRLPDCSK